MKSIDSDVILIATAYFYPQNSAGANRMASFVEAFSLAGYRCLVVAPKYDEQKVGNDDVALATGAGLISIIRVGLIKKSKLNIFSRFISESFIAIKILRESRRHSCKYFLITSPFLSFLIFYWLFVPANKVIFDIRDLTWEYGLSKNPLIYICGKLLRTFSLIGVSKARLITACTQAECSYLRKYRKEESVLQVNNGVEISTIEYFSKLSINHIKEYPYSPLILYAGTIGRAQGIDILCGLAMRRPEWTIQIIGDGEHTSRILKQAQKFSLKNLNLSKKVARNQILRTYSNATALFLRLTKGFETAIPSKIYEYLATGKPIIYMGEFGDATWNFLNGFQLVYRVNNDDFSGLEMALDTVLNSPEKISSYNITRIQNEFTRESQVEKLKRWIIEDNY